MSARALTPTSQPVPELDRDCADRRCGGRPVLRQMRQVHLYESPVAMPDRDYPCTVCGRLRVDWTHWYQPPPTATHVVQCGDCQLILGSTTVAGDRS
jgi:hypothetical protein